GPGVAEVDALARLEGEVERLVRVVHPDPAGVLGRVVDHVDVAVMARGREQAVVEGAAAGREPREREHLGQVVLEVAPAVAAADAIAVAWELPVAPVEGAVEADARMLGLSLLARDRRPVVPALGAGVRPV